MNYYEIPDNCSHVKIDIGLSYGANQSSDWLENEPDVMVFGFEPHPESYQCLMQGNIQLRHPSHIEGGLPLDKRHIDSGRMYIYNVALGNVQAVEHMNFYMNANDCGTSSLFPHEQKFLGPIANVVHVPVYSLAMFFDGFPWNRIPFIDYIKVDAQGSDLNILKGAANYLSERVVYITAEPDGNQYIGADECNAENITQYMNSIGFDRVQHPNTRDPTFINRKYRFLADKIYIRQR